MIEENEIPKIQEKVLDKTKSLFTIEPLYPGYGATLGNALRRVLISSLPGTAVSSVKLEGIPHEFSAIPHVKEDMIEIIMNLRKINFKSHSDEPVTIDLSAKGPKVIKASDFELVSDIEILNPGQHIAALDKHADFNLEVVVEKGRGFRPTEEKDAEKNDIGTIAIDSAFSPVRLVNFKVDHTRVGQMTNYDKIELEITTSGSITPKEAMIQADKILVEYFNYIADGISAENKIKTAVSTNDAVSLDSKTIEEVDPKTKIAELDLSARTVNALVSAGIKSVAGLKRISDLKLSEVKGLGRIGFDEVKNLLGR